ncbi:MAG: biopolymer transporter ExbD [Coleofasciculus sp. Co-bin14]|nr:biopolymer transporter ExbD [Coleofasciculus sp. Co-bin14]
MRLPDDSEAPFQINIVPMIDILFCILAFFIVSSLYLIRSEGLPVNLPKAATAQTQPQSQIVVTINADGRIALNRTPIRLQQLASGVRSLMGQRSEAVVVINADERVTHGRVVSVIDRLNQVPGVRLAIAAQR